MATPLLATKLHLPRLRAERIRRPQLIERLNAGLDRPLTLISAPAGFGKTTLVAEWLTECPRPSAWISLDEQDSDPTRFLAYLTAALRQIEDEAGQATLAALAFAGSHASLPSLMPQLVSEISTIPEEFILVLDDYHLITAQPIHDAMAFLVDHPPACMHLVLATRADPPLPLARLRARGQLNELRQADLRFMPAEAAVLLERALGAGIASGQIDVLSERTEGWIAGLQMAVLALRELPIEASQLPAGTDALIAAFRGTHRHVLDYLVEEVLNRLPAEVQSFLLQTSILERLCGPLCDAVTGNSGATPASNGSGGTGPSGPGQQRLEELERNNLFITALDGQREWYRYHRLFADLLQQRLHAVAASGRKTPNAVNVADLHHRAAMWHEREGMLAEAVRHALAAHDFDHAAALVERAVPSAWKNGELVTALRWMASLPEGILRGRPLLCTYSAVFSLLQGASLDRAESLAQAAADRDPEGNATGEIAVVRTMLAMYRGDIPGGLEHARAALARLPKSNPLLGLARRTQSALYLIAGDLESAERMLEEDLTASELAGDRLGASASLRRLGSMAMYGGELRRAESFYQRALSMSRDAYGHLWPVAGRILTHLGELRLERNELDKAERIFTEAAGLVGELMPGLNAGCYMALARLRQSEGDAEGAEQASETARQLARTTETLMDDAYLDLQEARLALLRGDITSTEHRAQRWGAQPATPLQPPAQDVETVLRSHLFREMRQTTLARLELARNRPDHALAILESLLAESEGQRISGSRIELLALRALAHQALGQAEAALSDLGLALELAEPEGFVRTFIDEGEPMRQLLKKAAERDVAREYVRRLLTAMTAGMSSHSARRAEVSAAARRPGSLAEPLTEREVQVLRLLRTSLTTPEIAGELGIAPSTVRTFVKNLYGKLGVHRRLEAIERAEDLGLLRA